MPGMGAMPAQSTGKNGMATAALVLGIVGIIASCIFVPSILAIIFGAIAGKRVKASGGLLGGKGAAKAGLILGIVGVVVGGALIALIASKAKDSVTSDNAKIGECVKLPGDKGLVFALTRQDCAKPHQAEIVGLGSLVGAGTDPYDEDTVKQQVGEACAAQFLSYTGQSSIDDTDLIMKFIFPSKQSWKSDDGHYMCIATNSGQELTGSVKG